MKPEHVRLQPSEKLFGEKNLLNAQLEVISLMKHQETYRLLRSEEFFLKIALKSKIEETKESLANLDRLFPKPTMQVHVPRPAQIQSKKHPHKLSLEEEIEDIRRKLSALR